MKSPKILIADILPEEIPTLYEGPAMDLPSGAEQNGDGSITLTLAYPKKLKFKTGQQEEMLPIDTLTFYRVTGDVARKIIAAKDKSLVGFAASARMTPARSNLIINALDAADGMTAAEVVNELLGGAGGGLPDNAVSTPDGVTLSLLFPTTDADGTEHTEFFFPRMTVAQRNQAQAQPDILDFVTGKVTGLTPKQAHDLLDKMDGADFRSVNRVVLFLFGLGR
jgi:hypothetical protein